MHLPQCKNKITLTYQHYSTPIGQLSGLFSERGLFLLKFYTPQQLEKILNHLKTKYQATILNQATKQSKTLGIQLQQYFSKKKIYFDIQLDMSGTEFQISVWESLQKIPYGTTISYTDQALSLEKPQAVRAIANANGKNNIVIIIPCHRVLGKNKTLTGYAEGLERKKYLLDLEKSTYIKTKGLHI